MKKMDEPYKPLGRGQRLQSVIDMLQKQQENRPETIQEQLFKITGYDCSNEAAVRFCEELASKRAESYRASVNSSSMNYQSPSIVKSKGEGMWDYRKDFPSLGSQVPVELTNDGNTTRESDVTVGCSGDYHTNFSPWNAAFNEDVAASTSQPLQQPFAITEGFEKGKSLTMGAESIAPSRAAFESDVQMPDTIAKEAQKGKGRKKVAEFIALSRAAYESHIRTPVTFTKGVEKEEPFTMGAESIAASGAAFESDIQMPNTNTEWVEERKSFTMGAEYIAPSRAAFESDFQMPVTFTKGVEKEERFTMGAESITTSRGVFKSDNETFDTIAKGIGRGERLKMVIASLPPPKPSFESYIQRALGTECSNESIERFVKELAEKNERSGNSKK